MINFIFAEDIKTVLGITAEVIDFLVYWPVPLNFEHQSCIRQDLE